MTHIFIFLTSLTILKTSLAWNLRTPDAEYGAYTLWHHPVQMEGLPIYHSENWKCLYDEGEAKTENTLQYPLKNKHFPKGKDVDKKGETCYNQESVWLASGVVRLTSQDWPEDGNPQGVFRGTFRNLKTGLCMRTVDDKYGRVIPADQGNPYGGGWAWRYGSIVMGKCAPDGMSAPRQEFQVSFANKKATNGPDNRPRFWPNSFQKREPYLACRQWHYEKAPEENREGWTANKFNLMINSKDRGMVHYGCSPTLWNFFAPGSDLEADIPNDREEEKHKWDHDELKKRSSSPEKKWAFFLNPDERAELKEKIRWGAANPNIHPFFSPLFTNSSSLQSNIRSQQNVKRQLNNPETPSTFKTQKRTSSSATETDPKKIKVHRPTVGKPKTGRMTITNIDYSTLSSLGKFQKSPVTQQMIDNIPLKIASSQLPFIAKGAVGRVPIITSINFNGSESDRPFRLLTEDPVIDAPYTEAPKNVKDSQSEQRSSLRPPGHIKITLQRPMPGLNFDDDTTNTKILRIVKEPKQALCTKNPQKCNTAPIPNETPISKPCKSICGTSDGTSNSNGNEITEAGKTEFSFVQCFKTTFGKDLGFGCIKHAMLRIWYGNEDGFVSVTKESITTTEVVTSGEVEGMPAL